MNQILKLKNNIAMHFLVVTVSFPYFLCMCVKDFLLLPRHHQWLSQDFLIRLKAKGKLIPKENKRKKGAKKTRRVA